MYALVVLNCDRVTNVYSCDSLLELQETLELIEPDMDSSGLLTGENECINWNSNLTYVVRKTEKALVQG